MYNNLQRYRPSSLVVDCAGKQKQNIFSYVREKGCDLNNLDIKTDSSKKTVAVIGGGMSSERDVSYMSSDGIVNSLVSLGFQVLFIDMGTDISNLLYKIKPDVVFNALHGTYGEDGCLPGLLNILGIPYTGPGVLASSLAMNKKKSYEIFKVNGIDTIEAQIISKNDKIVSDPIPRPYVIKPISQGSSVGIELVLKETSFSFKSYDFPYGDEVMVEPYTKGQEIQVAVLNGKALGGLEIELLKDKLFYDYETKYTEGFAKHIYPAQVPQKIYDEFLSISEKVCKIFSCQEGIIRVEFIYDKFKDKKYILEVNTHPGMTPLSICPEIASYQGISYTELVRLILEKAKYEV